MDRTLRIFNCSTIRRMVNGMKQYTAIKQMSISLLLERAAGKALFDWQVPSSLQVSVFGNRSRGREREWANEKERHFSTANKLKILIKTLHFDSTRGSQRRRVRENDKSERDRKKLRPMELIDVGSDILRGKCVVWKCLKWRSMELFQIALFVFWRVKMRKRRAGEQRI